MAILPLHAKLREEGGGEGLGSPIACANVLGEFTAASKLQERLATVRDDGKRQKQHAVE